MTTSSERDGKEAEQMKRALSILMVLCLLGMSVPALAISKGDLLVVTNCKSWQH